MYQLSFKVFIDELKPMWPDAKIDVGHSVTMKAVADFIKRVQEGSVYAEILNKEYRNKNGLLDDYNDNVCARITSAGYDKQHNLLVVQMEKHGPARHLIEELNECRVQTRVRAAIKITGHETVIERLNTFDLQIVPPQW